MEKLLNLSALSALLPTPAGSNWEIIRPFLTSLASNRTFRETEGEKSLRGNLANLPPLGKTTFKKEGSMFIYTLLQGKKQSRQGSLTVELILVLPILILVCLATIQFGILMTVHQAVTHAASVAAREAAKGASLSSLECIVEQVLSPHGLSVGDCLSVVLEDGVPPDPEQVGNVSCPTPAQPLPANSVRVTLCVDTSCQPFINPLASFGFSLAERILCEQAIVPKE